MAIRSRNPMTPLVLSPEASDAKRLSAGQKPERLVVGSVRLPPADPDLDGSHLPHCPSSAGSVLEGTQRALRSGRRRGGLEHSRHGAGLARRVYDYVDAPCELVVHDLQRAGTFQRRVHSVGEISNPVARARGVWDARASDDLPRDTHLFERIGCQPAVLVDGCGPRSRR